MITIADNLKAKERERTTWEIIKNSIQESLSMKTIERITGLTAEQINRLKEKQMA